MNMKDFIDLILKAKDNIYFFWNFYVAGVLGVMTWLLSLEENPRWQLKLLISIAYISFMLMNISGLLKSYALLRAAMKDYFVAASKADSVTDKIYLFFHRESSIFTKIRLINLAIPRYKLVIFGLHILIDVLILIALWNDSIWIQLRG